jgi:hypothetical protein
MGRSEQNTQADWNVSAPAGNGCFDRGQFWSFCMRFRVHGWHDFQHYKDRNPPWIRLHKKLLDNFDFHCLPVASRALAPMLWLLASESTDGVIEATAEQLAFRLRHSAGEVEEALRPLIDKGFFVLESGTLAECLRGAVPEALQRHSITEVPTVLVATPSAKRPPPCPTEALIAMYHEHLPMLPRVEVVSDSRLRAISARWRQVVTDADIRKAEDVKAAGLDWFAWFFSHAAKSKFLTGRAKDWKADLDFLMTPSKFAKVVEGSYHKEAA